LKDLTRNFITLPTRRTVLKTALAGAAGLMAASPALAQLKIVVSGAQFTPMPIAIPDFASSDPAFGQQVAEIVRADLTRSGLFAPLDASVMKGMIGDVSTTPDFATWQSTNADALVMGKVERDAQGVQINASVRVWDIRAAQPAGGGPVLFCRCPGLAAHRPYRS